MKNYLTTIFLALIIFTTANAQDLIERTQQNKVFKIADKNNAEPNRLAELVAKNRKHSKTTSVDVFTFKPQKSAKTAENVSQSVELTLNKTAINRLLTDKRDWLTLKVPVNENHYFELELVRNDIQKPGYQVNLSKANAEAYQPEDLIFYKGIVKNDQSSLAAVTISENQIRVLASDTEGNYVVGKLPDSQSKYVLYNDVNLRQDPQYSCNTPDTPQEGSVIANTAGTTTVNGQCVPVYLEADFAFYQDNNSSVSQVEVYLNGLFNEVEAIYYNESIGVGISEIFVHTVSGPYANSTNTEDALYTFRALRQNNFNGRLAHLVSGRSLGGGIAFVDVLCSINDNHAVSELYSSHNTFPTYSWDLYVFAHEMGHNFGSWHTHTCVWNDNNTAIDNCGSTACSNSGIPSDGGTIMSYCHQQTVGINFSKGFGAQPGNLIRNRFNYSNCILECEESCNYVGNPCNFIPNPNFDEGVDGWSTWNCDLSAPFGIGNIENIVGEPDPWSAQVNSDFLCLVQGISYRISFDAYSSSPRDFYVKVGLGEAPWTGYLWEQVLVATNFQSYTYEFTHTLPSTSIGVMEFHVGGSGNIPNVYLDNIVLQPAECSANDVCEKLENGDFENGLTNWEYRGMAQPTIISGACHLSQFDPVDGDTFPWNASLNYTDIIFEQNQTYTIQFSARSVNQPRLFVIVASLGEAPWSAFLWERVSLTTQMQSYSYTFTMPYATISNGRLEFQVGDSNIALYVDEVTLTDNNCVSAGLSNTCIENMTVEGIPDDHIYQAGGHITSKAEIQSGTNVSYFSGSRISLQAGFKVESQAAFKADIRYCEE